jgi:DNA processing protein
MSPPNPAFALSLLRLDGVGRVTTLRLLAHFPDYDALRSYPREQVLLRIKGAPNAADLVRRLFEEEAEFRALLAQADETVAAFATRGITVVTPGHPHYPAGLGDLDRSERPVVLYAYGETSLLALPAAGLFAHPPLSGPSFETAQDLLRHLISNDVVPAAGASTGFDVVVHKLCAAASRPCVLIASAGMSRVPNPMRPTVSAVVRAGGVLVSSFPVDHGPFAHDDRERALLQAALSRASAFFDPADETAEARAMAWALAHQRAVFGTTPEDGVLPERVHRLARPVDFDWVVAATRSV